ncbi:antitoxin family protein [Candidatus Acetothermia bacterium]|nr:antitoxin family protein [Candidatus Acetothermia bacterium]
MNKVIDAVYKKGALHPVKPLKGLKENTRVRVTVESASETSHPLERFAGILSAEEADQMLKIVEEEFERIDSDAW